MGTLDHQSIDAMGFLLPKLHMIQGVGAVRGRINQAAAQLSASLPYSHRARRFHHRHGGFGQGHSPSGARVAHPLVMVHRCLRRPLLP